MNIFGQNVVLFLRNAFGKQVVVVAGETNHAQNFARAWVNRHCCATRCITLFHYSAQHIRHDRLQAQVEREPHAVAVGRLSLADDLKLFVRCVYQCGAAPFCATHIGFNRLFYASNADAVVIIIIVGMRVKLWLTIHHLLEYLAGVAEDIAQKLLIGILARARGAHHHATQRERLFLNRKRLLAGHVIGHDNRLIWRGGLKDFGVNVARRHPLLADHLGQFVIHDHPGDALLNSLLLGSAIANLLHWHNGDLIRGRVAHQRFTIAVIYQPARGRQRANVDRALAHLLAECLLTVDLQVEQTHTAAVQM